MGVGIPLALAATGASVVRLTVNTRDPLTYFAILGFLALVGVMASWLPARRASHVNPVAVLRGE